MRVLSVVCARANSKGLPNKCTAKIGGKMVVEYAVEFSLSLGEKVRTVVSTDIPELIEYSRQHEIPFIERNQEYCRDDSKIEDAIADAIEQYGEDSHLFSLVYGNIPTRSPELFHRALSFLEHNEEYDAVISMQNVEKYHPDWMFDYHEDRLPREKEIHYRRQMLQQKMIHDGHTLLFRKDEFYQRYKGELSYDDVYKYAIFGTTIKPLINHLVIVDIDTEKDLSLAEAVLLNSEEGKSTS